MDICGQIRAACEATESILLLSLTRQVFFLIPLILLLPLHFGIFGILLAGPIADFIAFVVSVLLAFRTFKSLSVQQRLS